MSKANELLRLALTVLEEDDEHGDENAELIGDIRRHLAAKEDEVTIPKGVALDVYVLLLNIDGDARKQVEAQLAAAGFDDHIAHLVGWFQPFTV